MKLRIFLDSLSLVDVVDALQKAPADTKTLEIEHLSEHGKDYEWFEEVYARILCMTQLEELILNQATLRHFGAILRLPNLRKFTFKGFATAATWAEIFEVQSSSLSYLNIMMASVKDEATWAAILDNKRFPNLTVRVLNSWSYKQLWHYLQTLPANTNSIYLEDVNVEQISKYTPDRKGILDVTTALFNFRGLEVVHLQRSYLFAPDDILRQFLTLPKLKSFSIIEGGLSTKPWESLLVPFVCQATYLDLRGLKLSDEAIFPLFADKAYFPNLKTLGLTGVFGEMGTEDWEDNGAVNTYDVFLAFPLDEVRERYFKGSAVILF